MLINCSNHLIDSWSEPQKKNALKWGKVIDFQFPEVNASANEEDIEKLASQIVSIIIKMQPDAVLCQGEFTLTYSIVEKLKRKRIMTIAACSERKTKETLLADGRVKKESYFEFVRFRHY